MPSTIPSTIEAILETASLDPEFVAAYQHAPTLDMNDFTIEHLKELLSAKLAERQEQLAATRPPTVNETVHYIPVRDGWKSRTIRVCPSHIMENTKAKSPCILLLHGGGHCIGEPEQDLELARRLSAVHEAVVFLPSYRLAPDYTFPYSINDSWDIVREIAAASLTDNDDAGLIPPFCSLSHGFIIGGTSSGANLAASIAHLARDQSLLPPLTGQFLCCGTFISQKHVPSKYTKYYLAWEQNANSPLVSGALYAKMRAAFKPDLTDPLWASFDQHDSRDEAGVEVKHGHLGLPPVYFQACGTEQMRDDSLIYERVLREECDTATRLDLYNGWPHCWWIAYPAIEKSKQREQDTVDGIGWLLDAGRKN